MRKSSYVVLCLLAALATTWGCSLPSAESAVPPSSEAPAALGETKAATAGLGGESMLMVYPEEYIGYQAYLEAIGGLPGAADTTVIEGTLMSVAMAEVCPYQEERCSIEPYPSHWGVVRIDRIVSYSRYGNAGQQPTDEQASPAESPSGDTSPAYAGSEQPPEAEVFNPLEAGQEVEAIFVLTVSPAKVRYVPMMQSRDTEPIAPVGDDNEQTAEHEVEPSIPVFEAIPREGDIFVFTTRIGDYEEAVEKALPGLQVGSRFRAQVKYDGILYVEEYAVMR